MSILLIVIGIVMFMILILLHEFGHFRAAKKTGVKVNEFWIGLPPRICTLWTDKSGTKYTLNVIPLWGFCALEGEDPSKPETFSAKDSFISASLRKKIIIVLWGVSMNILTAWVFFTILFVHGVQPLGISSDETSESYLISSQTFLKQEGFLSGSLSSGILITEVFPDSLAESYDLQPDMVVYRLNDQEVDIANFATLVSDMSNQTFDLDLWNEIRSITCPETCKLWVAIASNADVEIVDIKFWLWKAMLAGLHEIWAERTLTLKAFGSLGRGLFSFNKDKMADAFNMLAWPVGAVKMGELFYQAWGWIAYLAFAGIISLALAIFNLLPIPALDGGRGIWVIIQRIFSIKPEKYFKWEAIVNTVVFYLLMALGLVIIVKDLVVFWQLPLPFLGG